MVNIPARTIRNFRAERPERFAELCRADARAREAESFAVKDARRSVASQVSALSEKLETETDSKLRAQIISEIDGLTRSQERLDKMGRLEEGRPTEITQGRTVEAIDAELARICAEIEAGRG